MPFQETCLVEERISMLRAYDTGLFTVSELASRYGVSRSTFYFWQERRARSSCFKLEPLLRFQLKAQR